jgi:hypothetical protein
VNPAGQVCAARPPASSNAPTKRRVLM